MRFLGIILRVLRLEVSVYNVYITNQFQATFALKEEDFRPNYVQELGLRSCRERKKKRRREKRKKNKSWRRGRCEDVQKIGTRRKRKGNKLQKNKIREGLIWREIRQKFSPSKGQVSF